MNAPLRIRPPAVAGSFYPADRDELRRAIERAFDDAVPALHDSPAPTALVVPHAGFVYSGPVAASAYLRLAERRREIRRVVLLGPSHRVPLRGVALSSVDVWRTPLGDVPLEHDIAATLDHLPWAATDDLAHAYEHSLEVQVPFLQTVLERFTLVPVVVGEATVDEVTDVIELLWTGEHTLLVVSTDLSHYHRDDVAKRLDARTAAAIVARRSDEIGDLDACGAGALRGLLAVAEREHLQVDLVDLRTSADTAGDRERVVGYGAFAIH